MNQLANRLKMIIRIGPDDADAAETCSCQYSVQMLMLVKLLVVNNLFKGELMMVMLVKLLIVNNVVKGEYVMLMLLKLLFVNILLKC